MPAKAGHPNVSTRRPKMAMGFAFWSIVYGRAEFPKTKRASISG
jgi:hypothetical protein